MLGDREESCGEEEGARSRCSTYGARMRMRLAISEHVHTLNHRLDFDSSQILETEKNLRRRRVKESLHILKNDTFNRDGGVGVDRCWRSILT